MGWPGRRTLLGSWVRGVHTDREVAKRLQPTQQEAFLHADMQP